MSSLALCVIASALAAASPPQGQSVQRADVNVPVLAATDTLVGRAIAGATALLLTKRGELLEIDTQRTVVSRTRIAGLRPGEALAGLGTLGGPELYTLAANHALLTIRDGRVASRKDLDATHFDLFAWAGGLLVQALPFTPGGPALWSLHDSGARRAPIGHLTVRAVSGPRVFTWARSFVRCGLPARDAIPCWNVFDATIDPIARTVRPMVRLVDLETNAKIDFEGPSDRLPRPIRDAALLPDGSVLVLTAGPEAPLSPDIRELRRYGPNGRLRAIRRLQVSGRLLLRIEATRAWLLARSGHLFETEVP